MNSDYNKYTLLELYDVRENINKDLYPERYKRLIDEIEVREQNPEQVIESAKPNKEGMTLIVKVIMVLCVVFFSWSLFQAYETGSIKSRGGHEYNLAINPKGFYNIVYLKVFFLIFSIYCIFKRFGKENT